MRRKEIRLCTILNMVQSLSFSQRVWNVRTSKLDIRSSYPRSHCLAQSLNQTSEHFQWVLCLMCFIYTFNCHKHQAPLRMLSNAPPCVMLHPSMCIVTPMICIIALPHVYCDTNTGAVNACTAFHLLWAVCPGWFKDWSLLVLNSSFSAHLQ